VNGTGGMNVAVPFDIKNVGTPAITAITLDVDFDATKLSFNPNAVTTGTAASGAGKMVAASSPSAGVARIVVFGVNTNAIGDGSLGTLGFTVLAGVTGKQVLTQAKVVASDAGQKAVTVSSQNGVVNAQ
jgi:hypothetical protein